MNKSTSNAIKSAVSEIKKEKEVSGIFLFGSHATGRAKPYSDIDICVLARKGIPRKTKERILSNSSRKTDITIFWELPPQIRFRVIREGKVLFARDNKELQRAEVETVKSYLDFKHVLEFFEKKYVGA